MRNATTLRERVDLVHGKDDNLHLLIRIPFQFRAALHVGPVVLRENDDNSLLGTNYTGPNGNGVDTPNFNGGKLTFHDPRTGQPYFDPNMFSKEEIGQLG